MEIVGFSGWKYHGRRSELLELYVVGAVEVIP